ncbi:ABC transporter ATP-binding protein [Oceanirhabdus seepicola]|uniref:ATP-binding cassette domain-containing protein n=1 Tax=Oceanirhabdus seepicola TaxID=2828781 RepID=A0A9J6PAH0_9CLOT|nr:ATP-binding cassette domain-containing protein [Oceanirhabdus seepicola]MCM1992782.1 ATP-binding cassette domain-containing protein [Oceanirhabdus seepicola]
MRNSLNIDNKIEIKQSELAPVVSIKNLKKHFISGVGKQKLVVKAVDGVSFDIQSGEIFGLVGESGCGKTTLGRTLIKLHEPTDGTIEFLGRPITEGIQSNIEAINEAKEIIKSHKDAEKKAEAKNTIKFNKKEIRRKKRQNEKNDYELTKKMQMIFQDPIASLDPRMTVKEIIAEGLRISGVKKDDEITKQVHEVLETVGLVPEHANRYPHEFSGGQRQRIGIGRALVLNPTFLIADEPISALDVSIQAQIINLLNDLRKEYGITILFVAHDLSVVKYISDRVGVMYFGNMVELAPADELFANPLHPYTKSLLSAVPLADPNYEKYRKRVTYNPQTTHDYSEEKPVFQEIKEGHFILANSKEMEEYRRELKG